MVTAYGDPYRRVAAGAGPVACPFSAADRLDPPPFGPWGDMTRIDAVSVDDVSGFWVTGPVTVTDLITTGDAAISWHHLQAASSWLRSLIVSTWYYLPGSPNHGCPSSRT
jgi:hypothetical protein